MKVHPIIGMRVEEAGARQKMSSSLLSSVLSVSCTPSWVQFPVLISTALQYSKCPISSENATLYEWAVHDTRVCSLDVLYIGSKIMLLQCRKAPCVTCPGDAEQRTIPRNDYGRNSMICQDVLNHLYFFAPRKPGPNLDYLTFVVICY